MDFLPRSSIGCVKCRKLSVTKCITDQSEQREEGYQVYQGIGYRYTDTGCYLVTALKNCSAESNAVLNVKNVQSLNHVLEFHSLLPEGERFDIQQYETNFYSLIHKNACKYYFCGKHQHWKQNVQEFLYRPLTAVIQRLQVKI